ncbi:MAG: hypothetical protein A2655_03125 [Candidatus Yanofskybacteria bacterium RIFCSPHIGHO2_01_FULL_43_42]|uniref:Uncharacterized protein n=1 Tax=Candidatus Yanofskybacteria bacterium RIFCSPLOWO2_01_FULL_43_22 TaxID=1802695 RepID=A0A1F8GGV0_9BACT|nr:MAG: hypothetical protein A2655_03125 [Candidatus Yanofskybacteria bacterium RIFCSPHIGHO2_01_FULL_43_42]OGN12993.1 MAG: hypothetical protein A3D48_03785 [Candidatus Yanofskybacteria bacterium RIFCSPHIGHO2_02_FULL_43_17]OGN23926.1 MAG: hypothetical protein A3A13_02470 [Candidatus Yanofskybacteria bacterium RIFCSPLOWO2_01_FULL_43_22]
MSDSELLKYVGQSRQKGLTDEQIKQNLLGSGWQENDINQALKPVKKKLAVLMYFGIGILISIFTGDWRDPFAKFHLKQGIILYIVSIGLDIAFGVSRFVVDEGGVKTSLVYSLVGFFVNLTVFAIGIRGIVNAATGKMDELPIIGGLAKYFKF